MRFSFYKPTLILSILFVIGFVWARSNGITGKTLLSDSPGCTCHNTNASSGVNVVISGPESMTPGAVATFQVEIFGLGSAAGINIAANGGSLEPVDNSLKSSNGELTHTSPKSASNSVVQFNFQFTAPQSKGQVVIAATGNSVNENGTNTGDFWNHAPNFTVNVDTTTILEYSRINLPNKLNLEQNFPNPFNPSTTIRFSVPQKTFVKLSIFNASGERVKTLVNNYVQKGVHKVIFNAQQFPSGTYFYQLTTNTQQLTRKMLLIK